MLSSVDVPVESSETKRILRKKKEKVDEIANVEALHFQNVDASDTINDVRFSSAILRLRKSMDDAKVYCAQGERATRQMVSILGDFVAGLAKEARERCSHAHIEEYIRRGTITQSQGMDRVDAMKSSASGDETNDVSSFVLRTMLTAASHFNEAYEDALECESILRNSTLIENLAEYESKRRNDRYAVDPKSRLLKMTFRAAASAASVSKRAFGICTALAAGTKGGHGEGDSEALTMAEGELESYVSELPADATAFDVDDFDSICAKVVCREVLSRDATKTSRSNDVVRHAGCVQGCVGSLSKVEDRSLNQVVSTRKDSSCSRYCEGVATQPTIVAIVSGGNSVEWIDFCERGCVGGYKRRPPCLVSDDESAGTVECH
eukprot:g959.t1